MQREGRRPPMAARTAVARWVYPHVRWSHIPGMLGYAVMGGLLAGMYGSLHDQITYSISPEYFTRFKFIQFRYADFGFPPRVFAAVIGFLASWWVGFFAAWFVARMAVPAFSPSLARRFVGRAFVVVFAAAGLAGWIGYGLGVVHGGDFSAWEPLRTEMQVENVRDFVRVGYIHNASYLGGLVGLIAALFYVGWQRRRARGMPDSSRDEPDAP